MSAHESLIRQGSQFLIGPDSTSINFHHFPTLDGLRAVAIVTVMVYHLELLVPEIGSFVSGGFLGVDIFFVLSGFLITSILLKEQNRDKSISIPKFFLRRFLRLAPAFWVFLLVMFFAGKYLLSPTDAVIIYRNDNFLYAFFYLMNWHSVSGFAGGNLNHTWSLAIEEQFYILWSLLLYAVFSAGRSRKQIITGTALVIVMLVVWRCVRITFGTNAATLYYSTDSRIDALLFGCLISMIYCWRLIPDHFYRSRIFGSIAISAIVSAVLVFIRYDFTDLEFYYGGISIFALSIAILILWIVTRENSAVHLILGSKPFRFIGLISYSLYLWHYVIFEFVRKTFTSVPVQIFAGLSLAFVGGTASYRLVEKPFLRLKDRLNGAA